MSLTNLHTISTHQSYVSLRDLEIKRAEDKGLLAGTDLSGLGPQPDGPANSANIGYGIDFRKNTPTDIQAWYTQANLSAFLTPSDITLMTNYHTNPTTANRQALLNSFTHLPDEPAAARLLAAAVDARETPFTTRLGFVLPESNERAALMSMFYNGGAGIIGASLLNALQTDNRAEAWYQIRYNSNNGETRISAGQGIANRRFKEADLFGLYGNGTISDMEAKQVLQMYTKYKDLSLPLNGIRAYDAQFSPTNPNAGSHGIDFEISPARGHLIDNFAEGRTIDGEVLVGKDDLIPGDRMTGTAQNDLIFGENGHDTLQGEAGGDVLYGGAGTDQLTGGTGNDYLDGGQGYDTYIYRINDGQDTIRDADGKGSLFYDGQLVVGGIRREGDPENLYRSMDGTFTFVQSGTDLIVNNLITIKNYTLGQNGITLRDRSSLSNGTAPVIDYPDNGLATEVITIPATNGPYILERTDAFNYVVISSDLYSDTIDTGIGNDQLYGNGSNDRLYSGEGDDQLFGGVGHDLLEGGGSQDRLYGEGGRDIMSGGDGQDVLEGGGEEDGLRVK